MSHNKGKGRAVQWLRDRSSYEGDDCILWPFSMSRGYGRFSYNGQHYYAHCFMCELINGPAPEGKPFVAHSCGNGMKGCITPRHLRWADGYDNAQDRLLHGRYNANGWGYTGKLTEKQIAQIRAWRGVVTIDKMAEIFGVSQSAIRYWFDLSKVPSKPGTSTSAMYRRRKKIASIVFVQPPPDRFEQAVRRMNELTAGMEIDPDDEIADEPADMQKADKNE